MFDAGSTPSDTFGAMLPILPGGVLWGMLVTAVVWAIVTLSERWRGGYAEPSAMVRRSTLPAVVVCVATALWWEFDPRIGQHWTSLVAIPGSVIGIAIMGWVVAHCRRRLLDTLHGVDSE